MERKDTKIREISFFSEKNNELCSVHSKMARKIASMLEQDAKVQSYLTNVCLTNLALSIESLGIRPSYMKAEWTTDFYVTLEDGSVAVLETADAESLEKKAFAEKLEVSRRYWETQSINTWKIIIVKKEKTAW